jgi:uncharacterized membrane protein
VGRIIRIFLSGVLALLPIMVTVMVTAWVASLVASYAGPGSFLGNLITSLGLNVYGSSTIAYFIGLGIILAVIFVLGLLVESGLRSWISNSFDWLMMRIPLVSNVYDLSARSGRTNPGDVTGDGMRKKPARWWRGSLTEVTCIREWRMAGPDAEAFTSLWLDSCW